MSNTGLATRLYRGEAGLNIVGKRRIWFSVAGVLLVAAILSLTLVGFTAGIEFEGGNEFQVPASVGSVTQAEDAVGKAVTAVSASDAEPGHVVSSQRVGDSIYSIRTSTLTTEQTLAAKQQIATALGIPADQIGESTVSPSFGGQVTRQAIIGLVVFLLVVTVFLVFRFEWRMAVAALASLAFDLLATATVYALVGFEVTPSTVIGFLTILGFALYDVVVVFDKVQENTRGITGSATQTYAEAANLAVNQTLMRSINTGLVALLPVGGLLFIGAGLLGAGTLKDLGLVLFIGMGTAVYSSIFFATPVLVALKSIEPKIANHTQRVLARRAGLAAKAAEPATAVAQPVGEPVAAGAPKPGAKPARRPSNTRPSAPKRR
ncbi:preprotein translocase subunit SecF [Allocatelliglobosispora scoriae]|uniref:Protein-export membrane protein SecF n=1 Tax=Allocatelliglobosispora scoriae TaxID=643052 RepID=A0A841BZN9_9ACTN|nr:protein translocase subunit SecF [Allocatelliglobosispora scoriae]MBB5873056.1 preprotein translocase subunit SecF [Allocatelliglobosispora scoriae]